MHTGSSPTDSRVLVASIGAGIFTASLVSWLFAPSFFWVAVISIGVTVGVAYWGKKL